MKKKIGEGRQGTWEKAREMQSGRTGQEQKGQIHS